MVHKPTLGSCEVPNKTWTRPVGRLAVYRLQTNKQTEKQIVYIPTKNETAKDDQKL